MQMTAAQLLNELNDYISPTNNKRIDELRLFFDALIVKFPLTGRYWKIYIENEMKYRDYEKVERLFQRCLIKVRHIELWRCYLNYIKETKGSLPTFREKMGQAYEFALEKIGIDFLSFPIWNDYVLFLKNVEAVGSYAVNQKITAVRRVYQRGVVNPMLNIENFWKDYIAYEQSINPMIADKMISDRSRDYMNARRVTKEYEAITKGLNRNFPATPPNNRSEDQRQVELWKKYIQWEISNPLRTEDQNLVIKRVVFAYEQCLLCLGHYPNVWYEYASYLESNSKQMSDVNVSKQLLEDTATVYERAISTMMKSNMLMHFAYADFEESRNKKEKASDIYNRLLENKDNDKFDPTLVYIQYIKFSRRADGIKAARLAFKRAREDVRTGSQLYTFDAHMEFYCSKDKNVACKIFELGLKKYGHDPNYILSYIDFLSHLNEENNTRVLFERVLSSSQLTDECSLPIWDKFLEFESAIGDLASIAKVEKRRAQVIEKLFNKNQLYETALFLERYKFQDLLPASLTELKSIGYLNLKSKLTSNLTTNNLFNLNLIQTRDQLNSKNETDQEIEDDGLFKPDTAQMIPFKPVKNPPPNSSLVPGGIFPPPPTVGHLLSILPHPVSFHGPFVSVDELTGVFLNLNLPEEFNAHLFNNSSNLHSRTDTDSPINQPTFKLFDLAIKASQTNSFPNLNSAQSFNLNGNSLSNSPNINELDSKLKTKRSIDDEDDLDDENSNSNPVNLDIYRKRQFQKRVK